MKRLAIKEIETKLFSQTDVNEEWLTELQEDDRKGVERLLLKFRKQQEMQEKLTMMHEEMLTYEREGWGKGYTHIAGLDEVGRGPLAGPVVSAAVILPQSVNLPGLTDSKKLSKEKREYFFEEIKSQAIAHEIMFVPADEIDKVNIYEATKLAMQRAIDQLDIKPDYLLLDAMKLENQLPQVSLIKGDQKSLTIAASSVLAKVARDRYMEALEGEFPGYGFDRHVGYGTPVHLDAMKRLGITKEHRKSFKPVADCIK
ncbi:ribonuclease HII [Alkalihalophilus lindianensis]|uniref:Ribonuclease HII n=1 Tax=Alkalihalophilus lindianensis TaxID=1630542 RepID=A0ABU3XC08_9BACI|nr:ribonuclease HII [Alkalihalophilus lindianensis]MDV2685410.1 ribonuclease HII [Alkalihalophilus lindianensis]